MISLVYIYSIILPFGEFGESIYRPNDFDESDSDIRLHQQFSSERHRFRVVVSRDDLAVEIANASSDKLRDCSEQS